MEKLFVKEELKYPHLFKPGKLGSLEIKNRIIKAPQTTGMGGRDGSVTERLVRYYREQARGGAGLIIVGYAWVDDKASKSAQCQIGIADNEHIPGLAWLAQSIQDMGAKAAIQIEHCGRQKFLGTPPIKAPSRVPWEELHNTGGAVPEELTFEEIQEIVEAFGDAARRAQWAGFDMVEVHGAHGYLITNFLSPRTNKRTDWYGGSLENRMRFLLEIIRNIRQKVGPAYPLSVRLSGSEYEPDGVTIEETVQVAKALEKLGIDVIHLSGGNHHTMHHQVSPMFVPAAHNAWAAEAVKKVVNIPVIASGSLNTPELAEELLAKGSADFVALGRPLFADPFFPQKAFAGKPEDIAPCIRCNDGCLDRSFFLFQSVRCTVNAALGKEDSRKIVPAEKKKKVAVIGGGPGGMEAARVCALRGHDVTLFEKRKLGGALIEASVPDFKADLKLLIRYLSAQMDKLDIEVKFQEVTPQFIAAGDFDVVIVAVGGTLIKPDLPGIDEPIVSDVLALFNGDLQLGQNIIIVGAGMIGLEAALYLTEQGKQVTSICRRDSYINDIGPASIGGFMERFAKNPFTVLTGKRLEAVQKNGAVIVDRFGKKEEVLGDNVIFCIDLLPQTWFAEELASLTDVNISTIGDCVKPRKIFDAIHEGYIAALSI
ncbi:MAG: NAD(P)/FAD-dependent oxidoreductase [Bacillota bacterium]